MQRFGPGESAGKMMRMRRLLASKVTSLLPGAVSSSVPFAPDEGVADDEGAEGVGVDDAALGDV